MLPAAGISVGHSLLPLMRAPLAKISSERLTTSNRPTSDLGPEVQWKSDLSSSATGEPELAKLTTRQNSRCRLREVPLHHQQTKLGSRETGGAQYCLHELPDQVSESLLEEKVVSVALVDPYSATPSTLTVVLENRKLP